MDSASREEGKEARRKRKREKHSNEEPNKKPPTSQGIERQKIKISVAGDEHTWKPVIVSAPGLRYESKTALKAYAKNQELLLATSFHPKLDYVAQEETLGRAEDLLEHYLGIYDPASGEVQLIPAKELVLRSKLRQSKTEKDAEEEQKNAVNARIRLGEAFGTKKSKKALATRAENAITSSQSKIGEDGKVVLDNAAAAILDTMASVTGTMSTKEALQLTSDATKPRPKMNLEAKAPHEVFDLNDIIGDDIIKLLDTRAWEKAITDNAAIHSFSQFVAKRVEAVMKEGKASKKHKILRYYQALHDWQRCLQKGAREGWKVPKRAEVEESVEGVNERILSQMKRKFAPDGTLNRWYQGYLYTHLFTLALIIDDYSVDISDLEIDTGLEHKEILKYFEELGCKTRKMSNMEREKRGLQKQSIEPRRMAVLRIPLVFPKLRVPMRRR